MLKRMLTHLISGRWQVMRYFPSANLRNIENSIKASEQTHRGEIRFAIEACLHWSQVWRDVSPRERALQVFSDLRVWDTEENTGVLLYILLADRQIEIIADRGINKLVAQSEWDAICQGMEKGMASGEYEQAILEGLARITQLLSRHFPANAVNPNELPNAPTIL